MLDIKYIRDNKDEVAQAALNKGIKINVDHILEIDATKRTLEKIVQDLRAERNDHTATISGKPTEEQLEKGRKLKEKIEKEEAALTSVAAELEEALLQIPNVAKKDVKVGKDESENEVLRTVGKVPSFDFEIKDHVELGTTLDIIDIDRAAKVSGARFYYLKGEGALLELALMRYALEIIQEEGFKPVLPPVLIKKDVMRRLGYMEHGADEDIFQIEKDNLVLVGTAEHSVVAMHQDETFKKTDLPIRYVGFSPSFRREAGSYGKDTKGILRVHQFDKVEMVSYVEEGADDKEHEKLLAIEEKLFKGLGIAYQVIKQCTGDLGFTAARKYDLEAWIPSQDKYREVTSCSTIGDFQSRRLNIKYTDDENKKYVSILNGTGISMARAIIAVIENNQQADGSIVIPEVLQKYTGFDKISAK